MVTAGTLHKQHFYLGHARLATLEAALFDTAGQRGWELHAWALFSNHYHLIAQAPPHDGDVGRFAQQLHSRASIDLNKMDDTLGRRVWYQYWDKGLTFEKSYYPRLNYVMQNPVRHGVVTMAHQYPYCSAHWFSMHSTAAYQKKVESFRFERLQVFDEYEPETRET